jgi:hypothetical protein
MSAAKPPAPLGSLALKASTQGKSASSLALFAACDRSDVKAGEDGVIEPSHNEGV